ncbi:bacteriohemerythrin [Caproiciproducens galactitolivorans]|uniref:Hemerythrin family protein n=1 Tax=Caproiciproducens galactitolivorans TaxID=642589 RepID=A0ABT4BT89_9FIRM|nr:hemerythrin family protein [Caproiciproducens galactitolivorans]MCY1713156.1 hemerythrin family protein [Caproiciproducens galactitolivorans]
MAMWKESLKIGVSLIDSEHKELCDRIDQLFAACNQGKGRDEIIKTLEFLEGYTIKHFSDEEKLQRSSTYPKCKEHKEMHEYFKKQIADLKKDITENGASIAVVSKTNYFLMNWLLNHIQKVDTELANYIK